MGNLIPSIKYTDYIPYPPYPKQLAFLMLDCLEAFFGGSCAGGKSDALLMAALQWVDTPGYVACIFRKTFADLSQPDALIPRSHAWLQGTDARWNNTHHQWTFPSGAILKFGYLSDYNSKYNYQGAAYSYLAFDEVTHIDEDSYKYLFSRLRKPRCAIHKIPDMTCPVCRQRSELANVPLRVRAASNPPAMGQGQWVRDRFRVKLVDGIYRGTHPTRAYVPSFITDNKAIDPEEYLKSLAELDPITRAQLATGDWGAYISGRYKAEWFAGRTWVRQTDQWLVGSEGLSRKRSALLPSPYNDRFRNLPGIDSPPKEDDTRKWPEVYHSSEIQWFAMMDPAATSREGPGDRDIFVKKAPSWSVIGLFGLTPHNDLIVADIIRFQKEIPEVIQACHGAFRRWKSWRLHVAFLGIEANGVGKGVYQQCIRDGLPCVDISRHTVDKLIYATPSLNRAAQGKIYLPSDDQAMHWLEPFKREILGFTGHPYEANDQVDVLSHAGQYAHARSQMCEQVYPGNLEEMFGHSDDFTH